jgi:4-amino-4-deoxy-L-arabinose transferase-like glycosyltransferase
MGMTASRPWSIVSAKPYYLILAAALVVRLGWTLLTPALPASDFAWYDEVATEIVTGHSYSVEGNPTAFRVPGYPVFLAGIYTVFGQSLFFARLANVLLGTLTVYLVYLLGRKTFSERVGLLASAIVAFTPSLILYSGLLASENLVIPLLLSSLLFYLEALQKHKTLYVWLSGLTLGLAVLTRPAVLLLPVFWLTYMFIKTHRMGKVLIHALVFGITIAACIVPWTVRNYRVFDRFIPLATDGGVNLLVSFNEKSVGRFVPGVHAHIVERGRQEGWDEQQLEQAMLEEALDFVRRRPMRALALAPLKVFHLFRDDVSGVTWNFTETSRPSPQWLRWILLFTTQVYYLVVLALALTTAFYRKSLTAYAWYGLLLTPILYWIVFHLVFFGDDRYHLPILPIIAIFSAFSSSHLSENLKARWYQRSPSV